jgi:transglutaminase-like putative cysteine protease
VKIPARIAAGVVYSDRVPGTAGLGAFYYHAWPEVRMAPDQPWIPVDPTFGQFPADATHVKLVEGDLDRQIEIMAYMGRLGFKVLSSSTKHAEP